MNENIENKIENSIETIYADESAYVENFRIRPITVGDDGVEMQVMMRIGGGEAVYYLRATARYADTDVGHAIRIERTDGELVDEFETDVVTASPSDLYDAVQAVQETYVQAYEDWYSYAVAADETADDGVDFPEMLVACHTHEALHDGISPEVAVEQSVMAVEERVDEKADVSSTRKFAEREWFITWGERGVVMSIRYDANRWTIKVNDEGWTLMVTESEEEFPADMEAVGE